MKIPETYRLIYTQGEIAERIQKLSLEISDWSSQLATSESNPLLVVPILNGAMFLCADLVRHIKVPLEIRPISASASNQSTNELLANVTIKDLSTSTFKSRNVLIVDDIFDSGKTTSELTSYVLKQQASEVKSIVLVKRSVQNQVGQPSWHGFTYSGQEWLVGYGMDDKGLWRNLPDIYAMTTS